MNVCDSFILNLRYWADSIGLVIFGVFLIAGSINMITLKVKAIKSRHKAANDE